LAPFAGQMGGQINPFHRFGADPIAQQAQQLAQLAQLVQQLAQQVQIIQLAQQAQQAQLLQHGLLGHAGGQFGGQLGRGGFGSPWQGLPVY